MPCPAEAYGGTQETNRPWRNWLGNINYTVPTYYQPTSRADLVWILEQAEAQGRKVKAVGSGWSFEDCAVSEDWVVHLGLLKNQITFLTDPATGPALLSDNWSARQFGTYTEKLFHVEAGILIVDLNRMLESEGLAMLTLGGSQGQSLAGAISTSTHGSDLEQPALPGVVLAIHLVTTGGQEVWIESASEPVTANDDALRMQLGCPDVRIIRDDDLLRAARVTVGRFGVIYAYVIKVARFYRLAEWTETLFWSDVSEALAGGVGLSSRVPVRRHLGGLPGLLSDPPAGLQISTDAGDFRFLDILINPHVKERPGDEVCWVRRRWPTENTDLLNISDSQSPLCHRGVANLLLTAAAAGLGAYASQIAAIPIYGAIKAAEIAVRTTRLNALAHDPHITGGEALAEALNAIWASQIGHELEYLIAELNHIILRNGLGESRNDGVRGPGWQVLSGVTEGTTGTCYRSNSIELIFSTETRAYIDFVNRLLDTAEDFHVGGYISLRFSSRTDACLSMHNVKSPLAVSIEVASIAGLADNWTWIDFVERTAKEMGGRPHWGQQNKLSLIDLARLYDAEDIYAWREQCHRVTGRFNTTFSNNYTRQRGLEPSGFVRYVTNTRKDGTRVTHLCNPGKWWSPVTTDEAIRDTVGRVCRYVTDPGAGAQGGLLHLRRYLVTPADADLDNNLDRLPTCSVAGLPPPPSDRFRLRITSVIRSNSPWTVLQFICNDEEGWRMPALDALREIKFGRRYFYVEDPDTGAEKPVLIREYLSTDADGVAANNLANLPQC